MDQIAELRHLARAYQLGGITRTYARAIATLMSDDEVPELVLLERDVWISGKRLSGIRPDVCLTNKQVIVVNYASRFRPSKYEVIDRASIVSVSEYAKRTFEMQLSDGRCIKIRGLIGGKRQDDMTRNLYDRIRSKLN